MRLRAAGAAILGLCVGSWIVPPGAALAAPGALDAAFGTSGLTLTNFGTTHAAANGRAVVVQSSGRIIVAGQSTNGGGAQTVFAALKPDGSVDTSFSGGIVQVQVGINDQINAMALDASERIVAIGYTNVVGVHQNLVVIRLTKDGLLDTTFGNGGIVDTPIAAIASPPAAHGDGTAIVPIEFPRGVAIQSDGKIVIASFGKNDAAAATPPPYRMDVLRLTANGAIDTSFNGTGAQLVTFPSSTQDRGYAIAIQSDGKIVVSGDSRIGGSLQFALARFKTDGTLDGTFGSGGLVNTTVGGGTARAVLIDNIGGTDMIVAGGFDGASLFEIVRYGPSGALDTTFSTDGTFTYALDGSQNTGEAMVVQTTVAANHRYVLGGEVGSGVGTTADFGTIRVNQDGTLDSTYGSSGGRRIDLGSSELAPALGLQPDGKILQVGPSPTATDNTIYIARLTANGNIDTTFAAPTGYAAITGITGGTNETADAIALDPSGTGKLYLAGTIFDSITSWNVALARYTSAGALDTSFNATGKVVLDLGGLGDEANGVAVDSSGRAIVVGSQGGASGSASPFTVLRFTTGGALDTTFNGTGKVTLNPEAGGGRAFVVAVQPWDGKIVVGGAATPSTGSNNHTDLALVRFETNGAIDTGWNGGAVKLIGSVGFGEIHALAFDAAHNILVAGKTTIPARSLAMVARFTSAGALDTGFGGGLVTPAFAASGNDYASAVAVDGDGKVLVGGTAASAKWAVARYDSNGTLDATYGTAGYVRTAAGVGVIDQIFGAALQFDEKLVAYGLVTASVSNGVSHWGFARYNWDDGSLDSTFATGGLFNTYTFGSGNDLPGGVVVRPGTGSGLAGRILGGGADWSTGDFAAVGLTGDDAPTTPTAAPDLATTSDSGRSTIDDVTNDSTPTFTGPCTVGQTTFLTVNGALTAPRKRQICRTGTYQIDAPALADGAYTIGSYTATGYGQSANGPTLSVEIDTHVSNVTFTVPAGGAALDAANTVTFSGGGAELNAKGNAIVTVHEGATTLCQATATAGGAWTCSVAGSALALGAHTASAYQTDLAGNQSGDVSVSFFVKSQTTTAVSSSVNPSVFGQAVTFTAAVTAASGGTVNTGQATFTVDAASSAAINVTSGTAAYAPAALTVANHPVSVAFAGSAQYFASSGTLAGGQTVNPASTTTTVTSSVNPSVFGQSVTFTATVAPVAPGAGAPTGSVNFSADSGSPVAVTLVQGANQSTATWTTGSLSVATHAIAAAYQGSTNHLASSGTLSGGQVVNQAATTTSVQSATNPSVFGQNVTFTIAVAATLPGTGTPGGTVAVTIGGSPAPGSPFALDGSGHASFSSGSIAVGGAAVAATYSGSADFLGSSGSVSQGVNKANTATAIGSHLPSPSFGGQAVTVAVTVAASSPGAGTPGGTVVVSDDLSAATCSVTLDGAGAGSCPITLSVVATHSLKAAYQGDGSFNVSQTTVSQVVNAAPDLTVTKTNDVSGHSHNGGSWNWTLAVANSATGATAAFGNGAVLLTDDLPDTTTGIAYGTPVVTPGGGTSGTVVCAVATSTLSCTASGAVSIPAGGTLSVKVPVTASAAAIFANPRSGGVCAADPADAIPESNESNNGCGDSVSTQTPELALTLTPGAVSTAAGASLSYTLAYTNAGTHDANGVKLTETVPAGTVFSAAQSTGAWSCADGSAAGTACQQTVGTLTSGGGSGSATFAVVVAAPVAAGQSQIADTASIADDGTNGVETNLADNAAAASTPIVGGPDLALAVDDQSASVAPGAVVVYTMSYANAGTRGASTVRLATTVPAHAAFSAAGSTAGWLCVPDANPGSACTLDLGTLAGDGAAGSATFAVRADDPQPAGVAQLAVSATLSDDGGNGADTAAGNNVSQDTTPLAGGPDLTVQTSDGGASLTPPGTVTYTLTYANAGHRGAANVQLTETVPAGSTFNAGTSTAGWACVPDSAAGSACTLALGTLAGGGGGGSAAFAVDVASPAPAGIVQISDTAAIADDGTNGAESNPADNTASDTTPIAAAVDLAVTVSDGATTTTPGATLTYVVGLSNVGTRNATGVTLSETVPAHTSFDGAHSAAGWSCLPDANAGAACTLAIAGTVVAGAAPAQHAFAVLVDAAAPIGTLLSDTASAADDGSGGADATPANDTATDGDTLVGAAPAITSADHATFTALTLESFAVIATGTPAPTFSETGALPSGVTLDPATGVLGGTPAAGTEGVYAIQLQVVNGIAPDGTQAFTLTVLPEALEFHTLSPCRALDTRSGGGGALSAGATRILTLTGNCGIPSGATAVAINVTVVEPPATGGLAWYRSDLAAPPAFDTLPFRAFRTRALNSVARVSVDGAGQITLRNDSSQSLQVVVDVSGYFE